MNKHLNEQKSVRVKHSRRNKEVNTPLVDLSGIFDTSADKRRLELFCQLRRIETNEYNSAIDNLPKIERIKMVAALLIISSGDKDLNINELARRSSLSRAAIHAVFGQKNIESAVIGIYRQILSDFSQTIIRRFEDLFDYFKGEPPILILLRVIQAILSATKKTPEYAMVSFQSISLNNHEEQKIVSPVFLQATELIRNSREKYLNEASKKLTDHQIALLLFAVVRGAIQGFFGVGMGLPHDEKEAESFPSEFLSEKDAYQFVLQNLKLFASEEGAKLIDKRISETGE